MKKGTFLIGVFVLTLSFSACQNRSSEMKVTDSLMDSGITKVDTSSMLANIDTNSMVSDMGRTMEKMIEKIHQFKMTGNIEFDLASLMKFHHQAAIDMSKLELELGTEPRQKQIAKNIIGKQTKEIQLLDDLLKNTPKTKNYEPSDKKTGLGRDINKNMAQMMNMDDISSGTPDHEFTNRMIKHHKDGIDMGKIILKYSQLEKFKAMTKTMIADQTNEITELEKTIEHH
ncbi:DUF305 domain-containing protein [Pedobacter sp. P351]|uniref:DUF305 domain-containing protein n=1 Tax=Pedobacter superstes TaxID=3133441 RepID=UPI00309DA0B6